MFVSKKAQRKISRRKSFDWTLKTIYAVCIIRKTTRKRRTLCSTYICTVSTFIRWKSTCLMTFSRLCYLMEVIDARAMQSSRIYINSNFSEITCNLGSVCTTVLIIQSFNYITIIILTLTLQQQIRIALEWLAYGLFTHVFRNRFLTKIRIAF